jgi:hypothetical protein
MPVHAFTGHEDQLFWVRRQLSTTNLGINATASGGQAADATIHAGDTSVAMYITTNLAQMNKDTVHEDSEHVFLRDAKLVMPASAAVGIVTDTDVGLMNDTPSIGSVFTAQDGTLKPGYVASIGDS